MSEELASASAAASPAESPPAASDAGSSSTQPEAAGQPSAQPEAPTSEPTTKEPTDWQKTQRDDPTLKAYIEDVIARARASDRNKARREKARAALQSSDQAEQVRNALEVAREVASEEAPEEIQTAQFREKRDRALPLIDRFTQTDEYAELWNKHGKTDMDRRFFEDPEEYADWVFEQVTEIRANKRAEKRAMDLAKAMSAEQTADALRNVPVPMGGTAGGNATGGMTLDNLLGLSPAERMRWKRENKSQYDALVAQLAG